MKLELDGVTYYLDEKQYRDFQRYKKSKNESLS